MKTTSQTDSANIKAEKRKKRIAEKVRREAKLRRDLVVNPPEDIHPELLRKYTASEYFGDISEDKLTGEKLNKALNYIIADFALNRLWLEVNMGSPCLDLSKSENKCVRMLNERLTKMIQENHFSLD